MASNHYAAEVDLNVIDFSRARVYTAALELSYLKSYSILGKLAAIS